MIYVGRSQGGGTKKKRGEGPFWALPQPQMPQDRKNGKVRWDGGGRNYGGAATQLRRHKKKSANCGARSSEPIQRVSAGVDSFDAWCFFCALGPTIGIRGEEKDCLSNLQQEILCNPPSLSVQDKKSARHALIFEK